MIAVTPDKHVESLDGHLPIDIMDGVNFRNRLPYKMTHKKTCLKSPFLAKFHKTQGNKNFFTDVNEEQIAYITKKKQVEKSPSLKAVRRHLKSVEVMPEKFNVPVILEQLDNKSLELLNKQVMTEYLEDLKDKRGKKE